MSVSPEERSISRVHATISVSVNESDEMVGLKLPLSPPGISSTTQSAFITDHSTIGTFLNDDQLRKDVATKLQEGDRLRFGRLQTEFMFGCLTQ